MRPKAAEREADLGLLQHGVDPAPTVLGGVRHGAETLERLVEEAERLGVGPSALGLLRREQRVIDGLLIVRARAEMVREELDDLVHAWPVDLFEPAAGGGMKDASP